MLLHLHSFVEVLHHKIDNWSTSRNSAQMCKNSKSLLFMASLLFLCQNFNLKVDKLNDNTTILYSTMQAQMHNNLV